MRNGPADPSGGPPAVLSIAGTDPSGGAGIQADLKTFSALGAYGMAVVTAVVAQTTTGVTGVLPVPGSFVAEQLETLLGDVRLDAVKIGMLGTAEVIETVAAALERWRPRYAVLDPVMVSKSGHRLLDEGAVEVLRRRLLPLVDLLTPNLAEAADLLGESQVLDLEGQRSQAARLLSLGPSWVLLKGGHLPGPDCPDVLVGPSWETVLAGPRILTRNTHGTGCTLSAAIAALRPQRGAWPTAVAEAKAYLESALRAADGLGIGHGHGPVHHFHAWWNRA